MSLFEELKLRNVVRIAALYAVASWVILQISDVLIENLSAPGWVFRLILGLLALGFPLALVFSWVFELTPEGIKREKDIDRSKSITRQTGQRVNRLIIGLLALVIVAMVGERWLLPQLESSPDTAAASSTSETAVTQPSQSGIVSDRSLAVLPFVNMSGDAENEYFSDGLSEELLNSLARIPQLQVTGRTSSFAFKGKNEDLRDIGQQLNVAHVLEGSVRKAKDQVRITAQLINTDTGYHLWSDTYDRKLDDIFAIQSDIADRVATALSLTLLSNAHANEAGETVNAEAYQAYLRGNHVFQRNPDDLETLNQARAFYEQALELDPKYVDALYGIYQYWDRRHRNGDGLQKDSIKEMQAITDRMSAVAPESEKTLMAEARMQLLTYHLRHAIELYQRQAELYPGSIDSILYSSTAHQLMNDLRGSIKETQRAINLDPLNLSALVRLSVPQYQLGDCDGVRATAKRVLELQPDYNRVRGALAYCLLLNDGDVAEALKWLEEEPLGWMRNTGLVIAYDKLGQTEKSEKLLNEMKQEYTGTASIQYAQVYAQRGDRENAVYWLKMAYEAHDPGFHMLCVDPFLDPIHDEPGFIEMLQKTGFDACPQPPK